MRNRKLLGKILGGAASAVLVAPVLTQTSTAGSSPFTWDAAWDATGTAGLTQHLQIASDAGFTTLLYDGYKPLLENEFNGDDTIWGSGTDDPPRDYTTDAITYLGLVNGSLYVRMRSERDDGVNSAWSNVLHDTLVTHILLPASTGIDKSASLVVAANGLTFTGDNNRGVFDGARASRNGVTAKTWYEATLNVLAAGFGKGITLSYEYLNGAAYADLSAGGDATIPGGGTVVGLYYHVYDGGFYNPTVGVISNANAVGDTYQVRLDPVGLTASLIRKRGGTEITVHTQTGLPSGKTWRAVVGAEGTGGVGSQGTVNFGATAPVCSTAVGASSYEALAA